MSSVVATIPRVQFRTDAGVPLVGGTLSTFLAGTTTPVETFANSALTTSNGTVITLDARGECTLWLDLDKTYKFILKDAAGVTLWTEDNVRGPIPVLSGSSGSAEIGFIQAGAGAVARTAQTKMRETAVTPQDFGAVGDGVTDDTAALQAALTYCMANTKGLELPGVYRITSAISATGQFPISLIGLGESVSRILHDSLSATITLTSTDDMAGSGWNVTGISFVTILAGVTHALKLVSVAGGAKSPATYIGQCFFGYDAFTVTSAAGKYFSTAVILDSCRDSFFDSCTFFGEAGSGTARTPTGIYLQGDYTAGPMMDKCRFFQMNKAITKENSAVFYQEGLGVNKCIFVACNYGIWLNSSNLGGDPALWVADSHFNCEFYNIYAEDFNQITLHDNIFYASAEATFNDVRLTDVTSAIIHDNIFSNTAGGVAGIGVNLIGVTHAVVHDNLFQGACRLTALNVNATCTNINWRDNNWRDIAAPVSNSLTDLTIFRGRDFRAPGFAQFPAIGVAQSIPNATDTAITWANGTLSATSSGTWAAGNPTRLVVPTGITRVRLSANISFAANASGRRRIALFKNGAGVQGGFDVRGPAAPTGSTMLNGVSGVLEVVAGDYFELIVEQNSGGALNAETGVGCRFTMEFIA